MKGIQWQIWRRRERAASTSRVVWTAVALLLGCASCGGERPPFVAKVARLLHLIAGLAACGGPNAGVVPTPANDPTARPAAVAGEYACIPGRGTDYQVGDGPGQRASLDLVPWEKLEAGDTVRIFHRDAPYRGKFLLSGQGTAAAPIRICGVLGPSGQRPIIDGADATTRSALAYSWDPLQQMGLIIIDRPAGGTIPRHVVVEGLELRGAKSGNGFIASAGDRRSYPAFSACVWVQRGEHVVIRNNAIHDCGLGVFSMSKGDVDDVTKDLTLEKNAIYGNGVVGSETEHNTYLQSLGVVYQFNHYGPLRPGARGSALKDRSAGTVIRYNFIEEGARSLDLVDAQDWDRIATADPRYRESFVYGNVFRKDCRTGAALHYGGDSYMEENYRKGTLYFFSNTFVQTGEGHLFQLSTTDERAEVFNNVFVATAGVPGPWLRARQDTSGPQHVTGGTMHLGVNWISGGWRPSDPYHEVPGPLSGAENLITGASAPLDLATFAPLPGTKVRDAAQAPPAAVAAHPVAHEFRPDLSPHVRVVRGAGADLGAIEGD